LYKQLDKQLETRYLEDLALIQSFSRSPEAIVPLDKSSKQKRSGSLSAQGHPLHPPIQVEKKTRSRSPNPSRSVPVTPFGPFDMSSSRKTFTYLIATLNSSHPDHDFSNILHPSDFYREKSPSNIFISLTTYLSASSPPTSDQVGGLKQLETVLENEMGLSGNGQVDVWSLRDDEIRTRLFSDLFPSGTIWSAMYFIFSKKLKRVAYLRFWGVGRHSRLRTRNISDLWEDDSLADSRSGFGYDDYWRNDKNKTVDEEGVFAAELDV
jgi:hypothetical protein